MSNLLDNQRKNQIFNSFEKIKEVNKAYTEGIYADTPANRKLGRVGMTYSAYAAKTNGSKEVEKVESPYDFPAPDYLTFKKVNWTNPDTSDAKMKSIGIHKYGKKKPEISIHPKSEYDYSIDIPLQNSEMKHLLENIGSKKDCTINLTFSEDDMKNWGSKYKFQSKINKLEYNADKGTISYERVPKAEGLYQSIKLEFPVSVFDGVLEQFKK